MYQNDPLKVLTGECRLSYAHLEKPYAKNPQQEPRYSVTLLIPKTDTMTKADIDSAIQAAIQQGVSSKWNGVQPPVVKTPLHDGDGVRPNGEPFGPECKGHWVMTASSKQRPQVVHVSNIRADLSPSDIYSGMYGRVTIRFFPYNTNGNRGIGCGLGNVLKTRDGEPLGGFSTAEDDFAGLEQPGAYPQSQQQAYQQSAQQYQTYQQPVQQPVQYTTPQAPVYGLPNTGNPLINPITGQPI